MVGISDPRVGIDDHIYQLQLCNDELKFSKSPWPSDCLHHQFDKGTISMLSLFP